MPGALRALTIWNPVSSVTQAVRDCLGQPATRTDSFPGDHPVLMSVVWIVAILTIFVPLAVWRYRRYTDAPR